MAVCSHGGERKRASPLVSLLKGYPFHYESPTLMTSSKSNYLPKAPPPTTITLGGRGDTIQHPAVPLCLYDNLPSLPADEWRGHPRSPIPMRPGSQEFLTPETLYLLHPQCPLFCWLEPMSTSIFKINMKINKSSDLRTLQPAPFTALLLYSQLSHIYARCR